MTVTRPRPLLRCALAALFLLLGLSLSSSALGFASEISGVEIVPPTGPGRSAPLDVKTLLAEVKDQRDQVEPRTFGRIAKYKTPEALKALQKAITYLNNEGMLGQAYIAFGEFESSNELKDDALKFLLQAARKHKRDENQRAATRALLRFGPGAHDALRVVVESHREETIRALAIQGLLEVLSEENNADAAELIIMNSNLSLAGQAQAIEKALTAMDGDGVNELFVELVDRKNLAIGMRLVLLDALREREEPLVDELLLDLLNDPAAELLLRAIVIVGERETDGARVALLRLADAKLDPISRAAIIALGLLEGRSDSWEKAAMDYSNGRRKAHRMGAAVALGNLRTDAALHRLHEMLKDEDRVVRIEAIQVIGNLRRPESIPFLVARLPAEKGRIKENIATVLRLFTGLDLGIRTQRWMTWWEAEGKDKPLPTYKEALAAETERGKRLANDVSRTSFYGLKVISDRVAFVMDVSGSMSARARGRSERSGTGSGTRISVAKNELRQVLDKIPNGDFFNMIFFEGGVRSWEDGMTEMDKKSREDAQAFLARQRAAGGTNVYDALRLAFEDEELDTIYLLSDGIPSAGRITDAAAIRLEVQRWNATRKVQINTVSIGTASRLLQWLAEDNGGKYIQVL
ncbi:MAG: HEAT repeat protein [Gammaproteobacteria bacterium]|jgi:HEAT repeat protein